MLLHFGIIWGSFWDHPAVILGSSGLGHVARKTDSDEAFLATFRCTAWYQANRLLHHRSPNKVWHRQGGAQKIIYDKYLHEAASFFQWGDSWQNVAQCRVTWKSFESHFIDHVCTAYSW